MSGLAFHALNLIILNHNPINPELIRDSLRQAFGLPVNGRRKKYAVSIGIRLN